MIPPIDESKTQNYDALAIVEANDDVKRKIQFYKNDDKLGPLGDKIDSDGEGVFMDEGEVVFQ